MTGIHWLTDIMILPKCQQVKLTNLKHIVFYEKEVEKTSRI
jgi:hypothetical protein